MTGRGRPMLRGVVTGLMTAAGGIGHTLPFLIKDFHVAFVAAVIIVAMELATIAWIRKAIYGYSAFVGGLSGGRGGSARVCSGNFDRQFVRNLRLKEL